MSTTEPIAVRADPPAVLELPPAHLELTWRPLQLRDEPALHELLLEVQLADSSHTRCSIPEVHELLAGADLQRDSLGGFDGAGTLRAYALVDVPPGGVRVLQAHLDGAVHPRWRGRGIGRATLAWMEGRGRQKLASSGQDLPARLAVRVEPDARDQRRLYAAAGFSPIRWYCELRRDLRLPLPAAPVPEGLALVPWRAELDERVRLAHNEAATDCWGCEPASAESWSEHGAHFAPQWSQVALDDSGAAPEVVGYLMSGRYEQDWEALGYSFGRTDVLGVRRSWRGRGLGTALLATAMDSYRAAGMDYACLQVDTARPTDALPLYERLGFETGDGIVVYSVEI